MQKTHKYPIPVKPPIRTEENQLNYKTIYNQAKSLAGLHAITVWGGPNEKIHSQYGLTTYLEWLFLEQNRNKKSSKLSWNVIEFDGQFALAKTPFTNS